MAAITGLIVGYGANKSDHVYIVKEVIKLSFIKS